MTAYQGINPGWDAVVNRTPEPYAQLKNLFSVMGPFNNAIDFDPRNSLPLDFDTLQNAWRGRSEIMEETIIHAIDQLATWPLQIMPMEKRNQTKFTLPIWTFPAVIAQQSAPEAPPELSNVVYEEREFSMVPYNTGFKVDLMYWTTESGKIEGLGKVKNVVVATQLAFNRSIIEALLYGKHYYMMYYQRYAQMPRSTLYETDQWALKSTFAIQKKGLSGWYYVYDVMREEIARAAGGAVPTDWIIANQIKAVLANLLKDTTTFSQSGELINDYIKSGQDAMNELRNIKINEWVPVVVENETEPIQPLIQPATFGDHFLHDIYIESDPRKYKTYHRTIRVFDMNKGGMVQIPLSEPEKYCMRWDDEGMLDETHYTHVKELEAYHKQFGIKMPKNGNVDLMYYRDASGDYHVVQAFGDMEISNLGNDIIKLCAETAFNEVLALGQNIMEKIEAGKKLRRTLLNYDPNEETNAAFIAAHYLMNSNNIDQGSGLADGNAFGGTSLPTVVRRGPNQYVLRVSRPDRPSEYLAGNLATRFSLTTDINAGNVVVSPVPFTPVGYGSIPQLKTLELLGNSAKGSPSRLGYDDETIDIARDFIAQLERLFRLTRGAYGSEHVAFRSASQDLPDFFKSGNEEMEQFVMWAENFLCEPCYPFYLQPDGMISPALLTPAGQNLTEAAQQDLAGFDLEDNDFMAAYQQFTTDINEFGEELVEHADFLRQISSSDRTFAQFVIAANEANIDFGEDGFIGFYLATEGNRAMQNARQRNPDTYVNTLKRIISTVESRITELNCNAAGRPGWVCTRLSVTYNAWLNPETWNNGNPRIRPRSIYCPYEMFNGSQQEFIDTQDGSLRDPKEGDVFALYFVNTLSNPEDESVFDDDSVISSDKLFDGRRISKNMEERYNEMGDIQCYVRRMFARMELTAYPGRQHFELARAHNRTYPAAYLNMRINRQYVTAWAMLVRRVDVGRLYWSKALYKYGTNVGNMDFNAHYKIWYVAGVKDVRMYAIWKDMWCKQYVAGESIDYYEKGEFNPDRKNFSKSIFSIMVPVGSYNENRISNPNTIIGYFAKNFFPSQQQEAITDIEYNAATHPSAFYTAAVTGLWNLAVDAAYYNRRREVSDTNEWPLNVKTYQTTVEFYNPATGTYGGQGAVIHNTDHFGQHYVGCADDRNGDIFKTAKYQTINVV